MSAENPVVLSAPDCATARIFLQGAHVAHWKPAGSAQDQLFVSPRAVFAEGVPLRGGVPVIFPQFAGLGPLTKHGFARNLPWTLLGVHDHGREATLELASSDRTRALWNQEFRLRLKVRIGGNALSVGMEVRNTGTTQLSFTTALHTYLAVSEISQVELTGLKGLTYSDTADGGCLKTESADAVRISNEVDRNYFRTPAELMLKDGARSLRIGQRGYTDTVVWNPGAASSANFKDLAPEDYRRFLCVEAAVIEQPVTLAPAAVWTGTQTLQLV